MKKKMMKAIRDLNAYIDGDRQKLCDELHEVKLSHKRLERLLKRFLEISRYFDFTFIPIIQKLHEDVQNELSYPYYRVNWKVKGGKNA